MILKKFKPEFKAGKILTTEMLNDLQSFSLETMNIFYKNYSDGIVSGFEFIDENEKVYLSSGILKFYGSFFYLSERLEVSSLVKDDFYLIARLKSDNELFITTDKECKKDDFPLAKIETTPNACYHSEVDSFEQLTKMQRNFFDFTISYSAKESRALPTTKVMKLFGEALFNQRQIGQYPFDLIVAVQCLDGSINSLILEKFLASKKLNFENKDTSPDLIKKLKSILEHDLTPFESKNENKKNSQILVG